MNDAKWVYNNKIGYIFPDETTVTVSNAYQKDNPSLWAEEKKETTPRTFKAYINHGLKTKQSKLFLYYFTKSNKWSSIKICY